VEISLRKTGLKKRVFFSSSGIQSQKVRGESFRSTFKCIEPNQQKNKKQKAGDI